MIDMPVWEEFMIPTLRALSDGKLRHYHETAARAAEIIGLTEEQKKQLLPSGKKLRYQDRATWGINFLNKIGALERPERGHYRITNAGRVLIEMFPNGVTEKELDALAKTPGSPVREYIKTGGSYRMENPATTKHDSPMTPLEQVQNGVNRIHEEVAADLLTRLCEREPAFFEQAVVDLLLAMGYGGTNGAGTVTQLSNDGGIDGVIDQDILGLRRVYIQAKRYAPTNTVGRPDIQSFVGALSVKADSGVFITTSSFSENARIYAETVPKRVILIDGDQLTNLMVKFNVGVQVRETYRIVEIDEDFFE